MPQLLQQSPVLLRLTIKTALVGAWRAMPGGFNEIGSTGTARRAPTKTGLRNIQFPLIYQESYWSAGATAILSNSYYFFTENPLYFQYLV